MKLRRFIFITASLAILLVAGLVFSVNWLTRSESGARWILTQSLNDGIPPDSLSALEGDLANGLLIPRLAVDTAFGRLEAESILIQVKVNWLARELVIDRLESAQLSIFLSENNTEGQSTDQGRMDWSAPLPVRFTAIVIQRFDLFDVDGKSLVENVEILANGHWEHALEGNLETRLEGAIEAARLSGSLQLSTPFRHQAELQLQPTRKLAGRLGLPKSEVRLSIHGDSSESRFEFEQATAGLRADGQLATTEAGLTWSANGVLNQWRGPVESSAPTPALSEIRIQAEGTNQNYRLDGSATLATDGFDPIDTHVQVTGDINALTIESLQLQAASLQAELSGEFSWEVATRLELDAILRELDPSPWVPGWPGATPLQGRASVVWTPDQLDISHLDLKVAGQEAQLLGSATLDMRNGDATAKLRGSQLRWPLTGQPVLFSPDADLTLSGQLDAWEASGQVSLLASGYPEATLGLQANGSRETANIEIRSARWLGGKLDGLLALDWTRPLLWQGHIRGQSIDPGPLWPDWPGHLNFEAQLAGSAEAQSTRIDFDHLDGELLGEAIEGHGQVRIEGHRPLFRDLRLIIGNSRLALNGDLESGLEFDLDLYNSSLLRRWLQANIVGNGTVRMAGGQPEAKLDLTLSRVESGEMRLGQLDITGTIGQHIPNAESTWVAKDLQISDLHFDRIEARLLNEGSKQQLQAQLTRADHQVNLTARGATDWGPDPADWTIDGVLQALNWHQGETMRLELASPAGFALNRDSGRFRELCVISGPGGQACTDIHWRGQRLTDFQARIETLPLRSLAELYDYEIEADQQLTGSVSWQFAPGSRPSGSADLRLIPGADDASQKSGLFRFRLVEGELTEGRLYLPVSDAGEVDIDFGITDFTLDGNGRLQGRARLDLDDLTFLQDFLSGIEPVSGRLDVDAQLGGRVAEPHLDGVISLEQARFNIPALNLNDVGLSLSGEVTRNDRLFLNGQLGSGPGKAQVQSVVDVRDWNDARIGLTIKGENLLLVDAPSLMATASPDLHLAWRQGRWEVEGALAVPEARVSPVGSISSRVNESEDVEIVAGSLPDRPAVLERTKAPISGLIKLSLGDKVRVELPAVRMSGAGELDLEWRDAWLPLATGQILLNGELRTYGPRLLVEDGPVRFTGRPIDDPALDIRAERDILGNTQIRTAGIHVRGTAKRPRIEAYTQPLTNEDRAWALLITGSDFDYGQGVGAFDIGTYIAPKLYVSYGVSLFDDEPVVSARYDLRKGFGIKATASQEDNGIDASFTVER